MPAPTKGARLGSSPSHEKAILANLATALFEHGAITTTHTRAKRLQPVAERLITIARKGDLASRRRVMETLKTKTAAHLLMTEIGPKFAERPGGYTRITKLGPRKGDNAPMAYIELVSEDYSPKQAVVKEAEAAAKVSAKASDDDAAQDTSHEDAVTEDAVTEDAGSHDGGEDAATASDDSQEPAEDSSKE